MNKESLLKIIAESGYNVGFGAKKHFATYDIVEKLPNWISFITITIGIIQLSYKTIACTNEISIVLIIVGISALYVNFYDQEKQKYLEAGKEITKLYYKLRDLYYHVKHTSETDYTSEQEKLEVIMGKFNNVCISKQIFLSDWWAHYKFFYQMQIEWVNEQLHFKLIKDKVPRSLLLLFITILLIVIVSIIIYKGGI